MQPTWLIETDTLGASPSQLTTEIRRQGMRFGFIDPSTFTSGYVRSIDRIVLEDRACIIFLGTWPTWRHIQLHWPEWTPGGWCSTKNLDCAEYYPRFRPYLINADCTLLSGVAAVERQSELFATHARLDRVFIRPTGCLKVFNGRCVSSREFAMAIASARYDGFTQVLIAEPKDIAREWRFVIAEHAPIAASQYFAHGEKNLAYGAPDEVWNFVRTILTAISWEPDEMFIMDVCESNGKLFVMELNGFSCAGLYQCDPRVVVERASAIARRAWDRTMETVNDLRTS